MTHCALTYLLKQLLTDTNTHIKTDIGSYIAHCTTLLNRGQAY